ncbi:MAG: hypothetical protein Q8N59_01235 [bacterium]|nr:hypothetical protein [bacterium]
MENWKLIWTKLEIMNEVGVKQLPDNLPGVYRLSYEAEDGNRYVFYVGRTQGIKEWLLQHLSSEENICIKNYLSTKKCFFRYAKVTEIYIQEAAEKQMYKRYEPICNIKEPESRDDIKVNLT